LALAKHSQHIDSDLSSQIEKLPKPEDIEEILSVLRAATLREMSIEIVNGSIEHAKGNIDTVEYLKLINSWLATAEETVAAGKNVQRIAARRGGKS
jgi:hypothetical protein